MSIIDKYLKELVLNNRRVIIPDLGAFLLKEDGAGEKSIIFSSFLRYNDGFLEQSIAQVANIGRSEAASAIKKFVDKINRAMRNKKSYEIADFGNFSVDEKAAVQFIPVNDGRFATPTANTQAKKQAGTVSPNPIVTLNTNNVVVEPQPVTQNPVAPPPIQQAQMGQPIVTDATNTRQYQTPTQQNTVSQITDSINAKHVNESKKRSRLLWIIIFLLVVIVFLLSMLYLCANNSDLCFFRKKLAQTESTQSTIPTINNKSNTSSDSLKILASPSVSATQDLYFHVIAGCFAEKINAERFLQYAQEQGYASAEVLPKIGELYPVSIGKSTNLNVAENIQNAYNNKYPDEEAWLYRTY